jgi:hypothetical protein
MSPNLDFGLVDRSVSHLSLARQTSVFMSPQDIGHTVVAANVAKNGLLVKLVHSSFSLYLLAPARAMKRQQMTCLEYSPTLKLDYKNHVCSPVSLPALDSFSVISRISSASRDS